MTLRPNIVYLHSHDTGRHIQPYGHQVQTPNIQRLADQGLLFRQAFSAAPVCSASRAALKPGELRCGRAPQRGATGFESVDEDPVRAISRLGEGDVGRVRVALRGRKEGYRPQRRRGDPPSRTTGLRSDGDAPVAGQVQVESQDERFVVTSFDGTGR